MKRRVIEQEKIFDKVWLILDGPTPTLEDAPYWKYRIDNVEYDPVPISHSYGTNMIAIVAEGNFIGKEVEFI